MSEKSNIYMALMQAQKDMGPVLKNATNPAFRSKYADLGSVIETITEPLHNNGLMVSQSITIKDGRPVLYTRIVHVESGDGIDSEAPIISKDPDDPQKFGAAVTYMRRYSLLALLCLAPEDDDGNLASQPRQHQAPNTVVGTHQPQQDQSSRTFQSGPPQGQYQQAPQGNGGILATNNQINYILGMWRQELGDTNNSIGTMELDGECNRKFGIGLDELDKNQASAWIKELKGG